MIFQGICTIFRQSVLLGKHDLSGDIIKLALYDASGNVSPDTLAYSPVGEIITQGYTSGGITLVYKNSGRDYKSAWVNFNDVEIQADISARAALLYNSSVVDENAIMAIDFGSGRVSVNGVFRIKFPSDGLVRA